MIEEAKQVAQRLRKRMPQALDSADMDEAADTIDALVAEVERQNTFIHGLRNRNDHLVDERDQLRAENETLRYEVDAIPAIKALLNRHTSLQTPY